MIRSARLALISAILLAAATGQAHLCDDVWRQMDKLVLKPETTNLVVRDKVEFDIHMQHSMDRAIACRVRLVGESPAFDVMVSPQEGYNAIQRGRRYVYHVTLTAKPGCKSGNYPVTFRLIGTDTGGRPRELKTLTLATAPEEASTVSPKQAEGRISVDGVGKRTSPTINGNPDEPVWQRIVEALRSGNPEGSPLRGTSVRACCDEHYLYLSFICRGIVPQDQGANDAIHVLLARPDRRDRHIIVTLTAQGSVSAQECAGDKAMPLQSTGGIKGAATLVQGVWFGELAIPASVLGYDRIQREQVWLANFVRESRIGAPERSFWSGGPETCMKLEGFGELLLLP